MSDQDTLPPKEKDSAKGAKEKKFFFDKIHFDEPEEDEIEEDAPPPPPTFSEEELADARRTSYERGKEDGIAEAHRSFEKQTEALLEVIARDMQSLFSEEESRAKLYEAEALRLADAIFKKLFPTLNETHGLAEITNVIEKIIVDQPESHEIQLFVAPAFQEKIAEHVKTNSHIQNVGGAIDVIADDTLEAGDCRLKWKDGGGLRDISTLSSQIAKEIEVLLADAPVNKDNRESEALASPRTGEEPSTPEIEEGSDAEASGPKNEPAQTKPDGDDQ